MTAPRPSLADRLREHIAIYEEDGWDGSDRQSVRDDLGPAERALDAAERLAEAVRVHREDTTSREISVGEAQRHDALFAALSEWEKARG